MEKIVQEKVNRVGEIVLWELRSKPEKPPLIVIGHRLRPIFLTQILVLLLNQVMTSLPYTE